MLILTRKIGETVQIGRDITVQIRRIDGGAVRLGVDAPLDFEVDRGEVRAEKLRRAAELEAPQ